MNNPTKLPKTIEDQLLKDEDKEKYFKARGDALAILEPWLEINHRDDWYISLDDCYSFNLYSKIPLRVADLKQMLNCTSEHYTFELIQSTFKKYVIRARFHLVI